MLLSNNVHLFSVDSNISSTDIDTKTSPASQETTLRSRDRVSRVSRRQRCDYPQSRGVYRHNTIHSPDQEKPWRNSIQMHPWHSSYHRGPPVDTAPQYQVPWQPVDYHQWPPACGSPWQLPGNGYSSNSSSNSNQQSLVSRQYTSGTNGEQTDYGVPYYEYPTYYGTYPSQ